MADHEHGSMDVKEQEKTFDGFIKFCQWTVVFVVVLLIFMYLVNG